MPRPLLFASAIFLCGCGLVVGLRTDYQLESTDAAADADAAPPDASDAAIASDGDSDAEVLCAPDEIACTFCQIDGGPALAHNCQKRGGNSTVCIAPQGWDDCACGGPAMCPEATQVCFSNNRCRSCGEKDNPSKSTDGFGCKNGKICAASDGGCF